MTEIHTEIEQKYDVPDTFVMPSLAEVADGATDVETTVTELTATYFDTADLRLARRKMTLRRRTGGADQGWHLKLPVGNGERSELHEPWTEALTVPDPLVRLVGATVRGAELTPVALLRTTRTAYEVGDGAGTVLVEVADDAVTGERLVEPVETSSWREVEVELVGGDRTHLAAFGQALTAAGAMPSPSGSKLAKTLGVKGKAKPDLAHRQITAGGLLLAYLTKQRDVLLATDPAVRLDRADAVHKMRVASRRLRSALRSFDRLFDGDSHLGLEEGLGRLAAVLGEERDAEVLLERLRNALDELPPELVMGPVRHDVESWLGDDYFAAKRATRDFLDGADHVDLLDALDTFLDAPPWTDHAERPARKEIAALVDRTITKVRHRGRAALAIEPGLLHDLALHDARRAAKRSRYAADVLAPHAPRQARAVSAQMEQLQETLGDWHDGAVLAGVLRTLAARTAGAGGNGFTYGYLMAREESRGLHAERDFAAALKAVRGLD